MCGIVGLISKTQSGFFHSDFKLFSQLLVVDGICRGMDSTGVFQVGNNRTVNIMKNSVNAMTFMEDIEYGEVQKRMIASSRIVIGHNRAATKGKVVPDNAHPFHKDNIILVHNGTLHGHKKMADTDVDSEAVAVALSEGNVEDVVKGIDGAFAFVWYDTDKQKLFAIRNDERPMTLTETANHYILASEAGMVNMLLGRDGTKILSSTVFAPGELYSFDLDGSEPEVEKIELPKKYSTYMGTTHISRPWTGGTTHTNTTTSQGGNKNPSSVPATVKVTTTPASGNKGGTKMVTPIFRDANVFYKAGQEIIVRVTRIFANNPSGVSRWTGVTLEPGKPAVDAYGTFAGYIKPSDHPKYYKGTTIGTISKVSSSTCGYSIEVNSVKRDKEYTTWNGQVFSETEIEHICKTELCSCSEMLDKRLMPVTSITRSGVGEETSYKVTCPDCIMAKITNEIVKEDFNELYTTLSASIELSESVIDSPDRQQLPSGTNIVH